MAQAVTFRALGAGLRKDFCSKAALVRKSWLCHSDARQVSDLPEAASEVWRSVTAYKRVGDPKKIRGVFRQVRDLPRIGVAEPLVQVYSEPALTTLPYGRVSALTGYGHGTNILSSIQFSQITI